MVTRLGSIMPLAALVLLAVPPDAASSGFHRHDVGREVFVAYGERPLFAAVGQVDRRSEFGGSAVLVDPHWVLLSRHQVSDGDTVFDPQEFAVMLGGQRIPGVRIEFPPPTEDGSARPDIALMKLAWGITAIEPAVLADAPPAVESDVSIVGYGNFQSALALDGPAEKIGKHGGTNVIDAVGGTVLGRRFPSFSLVADLDHPNRPDVNITGSAEPTNLEMLGHGGDSGGGWFGASNGRSVLLGINSGNRVNRDRILDRGVGWYGMVGHATAVYPFREWIGHVISGSVH